MRTGYRAALAAIGLAVTFSFGAMAGETVRIAQVIPLTGPWADLGQMAREGAKIAAEEINAAGGIKSLGGKKIEVVVADAGGSPESAKNATQRLISDYPDLSAGMGAILSSMTLAATTATEQAGLPWVTQSYATSITERGLKHVFQIVPDSKTIAGETFPILTKIAKAATGKTPSKLAIIRDNTAASQDFFKPMLDGGFEKLGITVSVDAAYTPPLSDATPIALKVRSSDADLVFLFITALPDVKRVLEALNQYDIKLPITAQAATLGMPGVAGAIKTDALEGLISTAGIWPGAKQKAVVEKFKQATGENWMPEPALAGYSGTWILKEAIEAAGSADRSVITKALHEMDLKDGPAAAALPTGAVHFDETGKIASPTITAFEWLNGKPYTIYPPQAAEADPKWPTR